MGGLLLVYNLKNTNIKRLLQTLVTERLGTVITDSVQLEGAFYYLVVAKRTQIKCKRVGT